MRLRHYLQWHILHKCNLHCRHCYQEDYSAFMEYPDLMSLLDKYLEYIQLHNYEGQINLTGGEPLLHPSFFQLAEEIRMRGLRLGVLTNGTLITRETASALARLTPVFVQVSLDGPARIHDDIRGKGNFEKALAGIDLLKENGIRVLVSFTAMKVNCHSFRGLAAICAAHRVDKLWWDRVVSDDPALYLTTEEFKMISREAAHLAKKYPCISNSRALQWIPDEHFSVGEKLLKFLLGNWIREGKGDTCIYECSAGKRLLIALPDGSLMACRRLPFVIGHIDDTDNLSDLVDRNPVMRRLARSVFADKCMKCKFYLECGGGARCVTYSQTGKLDLPDVNCYL